MINFFILTTNQLILYRYCKEKIDVDKLGGGKTVKKCKPKLKKCSKLVYVRNICH